MPEPLLIGSGNRGKAAELAELLRGLPWDVKSLGDFPEAPDCVEDGDTFEANATKKAAYYSACFNVACVADDSGLVVDVLGGAPGMMSARYAGEGATDAARCAKLLGALRTIPANERTARFVCCAAFVKPGAVAHIEMGVVEGTIGFECRGSGGFGYDPLFIPNGFTLSFGELDPVRKHAVSHRGQALRKLCAYLESRA